MKLLCIALSLSTSLYAMDGGSSLVRRLTVGAWVEAQDREAFQQSLSGSRVGAMQSVEEETAEAEQKNQEAVLITAVKAKKHHLLRHALQRGASANTFSMESIETDTIGPRYYMRPALSLAVENLDTVSVCMLLAAGANPHAKFNTLSPLEIGLKSLLSKYRKSEVIEGFGVIKSLVTFGANYKGQLDAGGTIFHLCAEKMQEGSYDHKTNVGLVLLKLLLLISEIEASKEQASVLVEKRFDRFFFPMPETALGLQRILKILQVKNNDGKVVADFLQGKDCASREYIQTIGDGKVNFFLGTLFSEKVVQDIYARTLQSHRDLFK